jgi:large subunit ribosomal protein L4
MSEIKVPVYNMTGAEVGKQTLPARLFGVVSKPVLIQQVVVAQQAASRASIAHTLGRGEVRGGGKKPWKQKGTGRARHGSTRSPIWVGGGVTFGPTNERNYHLDINKKMRRKALAMVLSDKVKSERLIIVDAMTLGESKTKSLSGALQKFPSKGRKAMIVTDAEDASVIRAAKNLPRVQTIAAHSLNVVDLMKYEWLIIPQRLLERLESIYR